MGWGDGEQPPRDCREGSDHLVDFAARLRDGGASGHIVVSVHMARG
jgi:hypothetical protein